MRKALNRGALRGNPASGVGAYFRFVTENVPFCPKVKTENSTVGGVPLTKQNKSQ